MRNAQLKPGYNIQIGVDSEYIVSADVFQDRNDVWTLVPFLKMMDEKLGFRYPSVTADSGYESEEGYTYLRSSGQKPYIKPQTYEGTFGLVLYIVLYGAYIFIGANGLPNYLEGMTLLIDLAVGLVVACTVYGFYAMFSRGEI